MELAAMKTHTEKAPRSRLHGIKLPTLALGSSLVLAGCAGNPPSEQYAVTQSAVNSAISAGGTEFAAVEMKSAQDKLKEAELAMHEKEYEKARRLAEQAEWMLDSPSARPRPPKPSRLCRTPVRVFRNCVRKACVTLSERHAPHPFADRSKDERHA